MTIQLSLSEIPQNKDFMFSNSLHKRNLVAHIYDSRTHKRLTVIYKYSTGEYEVTDPSYHQNVILLGECLR